MLFDLTDEQIQFREAVRMMLGRRMTAADLRASWDANGAAVNDVWQQLADVGVLGIVVPVEHDGAGASMVELVLALEEVGYHGVPGPVLETAGVAAAVIAAYGDEPTRSQWLPAISSGEAVLAVRLDKEAPVVCGADADAVLVASGTSIHLVPPGDGPWHPLSSQDPTRRLAAGQPHLGPRTLLTEDPSAIEHAMTAARTATAAVLVGVCRRLFDMTVKHLQEREQFGRVIGSFQALKHRMADVAVHVEAARSLTWYAGYTLSHEPEHAARAAAAAKAAAGAAGALANTAALQLHGGIGFTWEHDLHLWLKRGQALERAHGSAAQLRAQLGAQILERHAPSSVSKPKEIA